jgi:hypothetical protein
MEDIASHGVVLARDLPANPIERWLPVVSGLFARQPSEQPERYRDLVTLWVYRDIDAPADAVWELLTNPDRWPAWGPTVRHAELFGHNFEAGGTGVVTTVLGLRLPFEITTQDGERWAWKVAGVPATDHTVQALTPDRCRVGFGVPWPAAPYLAICRVALRRLESMATQNRVAS